MAKKKKIKISIRKLQNELKQQNAAVTSLEQDLLNREDQLSNMRATIGNQRRTIGELELTVKELKRIRQKMLQEYFELGCCLSATREKWFAAERKLKAGSGKYHIYGEGRTADATDFKNETEAVQRGG